MTDDIPIVGVDNLPVTESIKLRGAPGSGKTTQAARRVEELIEHHGYDVDDLTWVTYRRSLAEDVIESLRDAGILSAMDAAMPSQGRTRYITTTHAAAYRACAPREMRNQRPASRRDRIDFISNEYNVVYDAPNNSSLPPRGEKAFEVLDWCQNTRTPFQQASLAPAYIDYREAWPRGPSIPELAAAWEEYKDENDLYDFHQQLTTALESNDTPPSGIVVIDEHHDATPLMDKVMRKWAGAADVAIVIGDPRQTVNTHEGADPKLFEENIDLPTVNLTTTYRVPAQQWSLAERLIESYHGTPNVDTDSDRGVVRDKQSPRFERYNDEWQSVPVDVTGSPDRFADAYDDLMFLTRTRLQANGVAESLKQAGHVFSSQSGVDGWDSNETRLKRLNALLKLQSGCDELRGDEASQIIELTTESYYDESSEEVWKYIYDLRGQDDISVPVSAVASLMTEDWLPTYSDGTASVSELDTPANGTLDEEILTAALGRYDEPVGYDLSGYPSVLTIHASKGMEAENVVLYDAITRRIRQSIQRDHSLRATEDRVWYVAVTRSSHRLFVMRDAFDWTLSYLPRNISKSHIKQGATGDD